MMHRRGLTLLIAPLLLAGCSYRYVVVAVEKAGVIAFEPKDEKGTGCFSDFSVTTDSGAEVWRVTADRYLPSPCESKFPVVYGVTPAGMSVKVEPVPLQPGKTYKVEGWDGDSYSGLFRFKQAMVVENLNEQR